LKRQSEHPRKNSTKYVNRREGGDCTLFHQKGSEQEQSATTKQTRKELQELAKKKHPGFVNNKKVVAAPKPKKIHSAYR